MSAKPLDGDWLVRHPLPVHGDGTDKNSRGRVLAVGGSMLVPGAMRLTAEAAFRAGAGKVRVATISEAAIALGARMPEAGVIALPSQDGEIAPEAASVLREQLGSCDAVVLGPGIGSRDAAAQLMLDLAGEAREEMSLVLDAACLTCASGHADALRRHEGRLVLTPHHGEMAACLGCDEADIADDPHAAAARAAELFHAVVVLKSSQTIVAAPGARPLLYAGGGVGLATGGSGDVLAGIIAGLLSRGTEPRTAAAWGVWLHGEAGSALAGEGSPIGFLARELLPHIPRLMAR